MKEAKKPYIKRALNLARPAVLESFFIALAGTIDTVMVSGLGSSAVAAIGLTTQPKFIGLSFFFATTTALSALVARRQGEGNRLKANSTLHTDFIINMVLAIIISILMVAFAGPIIRFAGSNSETHEMAVTYFRIIMGGMIFNIIPITINAAQRGVGNTVIAFKTNVVSSLVNIFFNYLLIYGNFGFPRMEVAGAAIATVMGTVFATIMSVRSLYKPHSYLSRSYIKKQGFKFDKKISKEISSLGTNILAENLMMRVGFFTTAKVAAGLGTDPFAVHNVGMNILSLTFSLGDGMQVAAISLTGNALGANKKEEAVTYGKACQQIGFMMSIIVSIILMTFSKDIYKFFFEEEKLLEMGVVVTRFISIICLLQISQVIFGGCLRGAGDVRYTLISSIISVTIIRSAVTIFCVNYLHLGLNGIWIGILSDQLSRFLSLGYRFQQGKWVDIKI